MLLNIILIIITLFFLLGTAFFVYIGIMLFKTRVPLISTERKVVKAMIQLADIGTNQQIYELGSGFGFMLMKVAQNHPQNTFNGFELLKPAVWIARILNRVRGGNCRFQIQDFFTADLSNADVILTYLWPSIMDRIYAEIWPTLKPGTKIISHSFPIKALTPDEVLKVGSKKVYLYVKD